eukprot:scaffold3076_cov248-Pinguiococcus_pyrenoidosus.AAC.3
MADGGILQPRLGSLDRLVELDGARAVPEAKHVRKAAVRFDLEPGAKLAHQPVRDMQQSEKLLRQLALCGFCVRTIGLRGQVPPAVRARVFVLFLLLVIGNDLVRCRMNRVRPSERHLADIVRKHR